MSNAKKPRKRRKWPWVLLALFVAGGAALVFSAGQRANLALTQEVAAARDITTYYSCSGNLTPAEDKIQTAKESLKVKELYVAEGDTVQEGDALLRGTDGTRLYAAASGVVETLYVEADDPLQPGSQVARIVDYGTLEVSIDVDEYDIGAIALGKEGAVYVNALDASVVGTVTDIARNAVTEGGVSYFEVKMQLDAPEDVRAGMSVEVNILNQQALGAVSLSLDALSYDEYNRPFVYKLDAAGERVAAYVETGVSDGRNVQIVSGVAAGESVYYHSDDMTRFFAMMRGQ